MWCVRGEVKAQEERRTLECTPGERYLENRQRQTLNRRERRGESDVPVRREHNKEMKEEKMFGWAEKRGDERT